MVNNMGNIALQKIADANSSIYPFVPGRSVDGYTAAINRWVGSSPFPYSGVPEPIWLRLDLGGNYWINRWVVKQMGAFGWPVNYNISDYSLQGSLDNAAWFNLDSVANNSANSTDRAFTPAKVRWVRVYITKGLRCNTNFAAISELEIYEAPPTDSTLSALYITDGAAGVPYQPDFTKTNENYNASVGFDVAAVSISPTATDSNASITVNGAPVASGQTSLPISVAEGAVTAIHVIVTPVIGDPKTYTINVTRASNPYLSSIEIRNGRVIVTLNPAFARNALEYGIIVPPTTNSLSVNAATEAANAALMINNTAATSGQAMMVSIAGLNKINIHVTSGFGTDTRDYIVNITRQ